MSQRHLQALFAPRGLVLLGEPDNDLARSLVAQLTLRPPSLPLRHLQASVDLRLAPVSEGELCILTDEAMANADVVERLGASGCRALIWTPALQPSESTLAAAGRHGLRILGPRGGGVVATSRGLYLSALPQRPLPGHLALIAQSRSIAAAALDWAVGRRIGFSWACVTGGEADIDVADLLDYAAMDPNTQAVALQLGRLRSSRKFMSAARACARAKPVVVLQTRPAELADQGADRVRSAAFARAGLVECASLPGLFDAIAAVDKLPPLGGGRVLVAGNGAGICALGIDALLRHGLARAHLSAPTIAGIVVQGAGIRVTDGALDTAAAQLPAVMRSLHLALADQNVDAVLLIHAPVAGASHAEAIAALTSAHPGNRLLTVFLGLETAAPVRSLSAEAGIATFTSPDAAARALRYRWDYSRNYELLTQTPPPDDSAPGDTAAALALIQTRAQEGRTQLSAEEAERVLAAYGLTEPEMIPASSGVEVLMRRHPELGNCLSVQRAEALGLASPAFGFAPLDELLATRLLQGAGVRENQRAALAPALVRLAQLSSDAPALTHLQLNLLPQGDEAALLPGARLYVGWPPPDERRRMALAPYPAALTQVIELRDGTRCRLRAVRPSDEPAVIGLLRGMKPESIRLRFFQSLRYFSHAMAARMTQIDYDRELNLVAELEDESAIIGLGTLAGDADGRRSEFGLLVSDAYAGRGLGRRLLQTLLDHARRQGVAEVHGEILAENHAMLQLARNLGFEVIKPTDDHTVRDVRINPAQMSAGASTAG